MLAFNKEAHDEWFTPPIYIKAVREVLGWIDLDPFSSPRANGVVGAGMIYTKEKSAFSSEWKNKTVFMNPPYSIGLCAKAVDRFLQQRDWHGFDGIVLTNSSTDTKWAQKLLTSCDAVCFPNHRISFWNADGKAQSGNPRGQMFLYFGSDIGSFKRVFGVFGKVMVNRC